jgi:hypothetical protein
MLRQQSPPGKPGKNGLPPPHVAEFLSRLQKVKPTANGWDACCPGHDDAHPSLGIALGKDNRILLKCRSQGCSPEQITAALGRTMADLFAPAEDCQIKAKKGKIVKTYDYTDEAGTLLFQVVRLEPKAFRQRRPDGKGGSIWSLKGVRRVLYRLPELVKADPSQPVFVVEGEKDADTLAGLGWVATTNPMGAGKWRPEYSEALRGRHVIILPDNDEPGRQHAEKVAKALKGVSASVLIINLPGLPEKGDVSDWLQVPGNDKDKLLALIDATPHAQGLQEDQVQNQPESGDGDSDKSTQAEILLHSATAASWFHAPDKTAFATVPMGDDDSGHCPHATLAIRSGDFKRWLNRLHYRTMGKPARSQVIQDAIALFEAQALFDGPCQDVYCRVGTDAGGTTWLDLGSPQWDAVQIRPDGWMVVDRPGVKFRRSGSLRPLPYPVPGGSLEELWQFVNVRPEDRLLLLAWLVMAFWPRGPYPVLCLHGVQGSAKSTTARVLRELVDPNAAPLRTAPRDTRDLMVMATHSWVVALDNLSCLSPWLSDDLCRLATEGGFSTRELYTNADEVVFNAMRPVILTGIEELATRSDLLDRSLILHLPALTEEQYRTEAEFWADFRQAQPRILGALLDAIAAALQQLPTVQLKCRPRLADFATVATAAETALGWKKGSFLAVYLGNRADANELALEASPLYPPLCTLVEHGAWDGTSTELLVELTTLAGETVAQSRAWPRKSHILSNHLRRLTPNLGRAGIGIDFYRESDKKATRKLRIAKLPTACLQASAPSEASEPGAGSGASDAPASGSDAPQDFSDACPPMEKPQQTPPADAADASDAPGHPLSPDEDKELF